ncbi:MAG: OstA-like protein [Hoylesella enoeca]|uniref:OstA-like protein n=1 Tax=Hoylesella enoeca TaxID=76123 RepID=UPI003F9EBD06
MKHLLSCSLLILTVAFFTSCEEQRAHTAPGIYPRDSVAMMISYGVNTLISDSGVIKYRVVTERWEVNRNRRPPRWIFDKGLFLEQFDEKFHVQSYIQCDTAYYYEEQKLWELHSRVRILTKDGLRFTSERLFWDENQHELYSNVFSRLVTPDRQLQGTYFRSDERMTRYFVSNSKGSFARSDFENSGDTLQSAPDSAKSILRMRTSPQRKSISSPLTH